MAFNGSIEISPKSEAEVGGLRPDENQAASVVLVVGKNKLVIPFGPLFL